MAIRATWNNGPMGPAFLSYLPRFATVADVQAPTGVGYGVPSLGVPIQPAKVVWTGGDELWLLAVLCADEER